MMATTCDRAGLNRTCYNLHTPPNRKAPTVSDPQPQPEPPAINVQFNLTPFTVIGEQRVYDRDGDIMNIAPETLADRVATIVADRVYQQGKDGDGWYDREVVQNAVDRIIEARVIDVLDKRFTPTNRFGDPTGTPTSLGEIIDARLDAWFNEATPGRSDYQRGPTHMQQAIDKFLDGKFTKAVDDAMTVAKKQAIAVVHQSATKVFTDAIAKAASASVPR